MHTTHEFNAEFFLEVAHVVAERRLRNVQL
jgi:hypothetical protein